MVRGTGTKGRRMIPVTVTLRSDDGRMTPHQTEGFAPNETCALAVAQVHVEDSHNGWKCVKGRWNIIHRPTGFHVGKMEWNTAQEAFAVLLGCNPEFPAWLMAAGTAGDMATMACKSFYRAASGDDRV
jgi:hypothetical protein